MPKELSISLCMIVKNEEQFLFDCLTSVKDLVSEMIIVDTGSTDRTIEIARSFQAQIFSFQWIDDFSVARNYAISKAHGDWILLPDADEMLEISDHDKVRSLLSTATCDGFECLMQNYSSMEDHANFSTHYAFRILRNNHKYHYVGKIHEQIVSLETNQPLTDKKATSDIRFHHYGYIESVITAKQKRERNFPLLIAEVQKNPDNPFLLFNLGNEYLALQDYERAIAYYSKSYEHVTNLTQFVPHLYYRIIYCLFNLKQYPQALIYINKALTVFPTGTDYEYYRGLVYNQMHNIPLAIDSFKRCIQLGPAPAELNFVNDCSTYRPNVMLGNLYSDLKDYKTALGYYQTALTFSIPLSTLIHPVCHCIVKIESEEKAATMIQSFFPDLTNSTLLLLYLIILMQEKLYSYVEEPLRLLSNRESCKKDYHYLKGKLEWRQKNYNKSLLCFLEYFETADNLMLSLPEFKSDALNLAFLSVLQNGTKNRKKILSYILKECDEKQWQTYKEFYQIYSKDTYTNYFAKEQCKEEADSDCLPIIMQLLTYLIENKEYDQFEQYLYVLNRIDSKQVLVELSKLYEKAGFHDMAVSTALQSIKELDRYDNETLHILLGN